MSTMSMLQQPLALKLSARTILVNLDSVRTAKGVDAESVIAMVDNVLHPEHIKFVFDLSLPGTTRRELRFWITEIVAPDFVAGLAINQAVAEIIGARETFRRSEIEMQWVCHAATIMRLIKAGELAEEGNRLLSVSLKNFLIRRWISNPQSAIRNPQSAIPMSSQVTKAIELARQKVNTRAFNNYLDNQRRAFLDKLLVASQHVVIGVGSDSVIKPPRVRLTDWEQQFVASHVAEKQPFTDATRNCIDDLRRQHEHRVC
jgi:hypothetical protein